MDIKNAIQYLRPIADSATLPNYSSALNAVLAAAEEVEFTRQFVHAHGLDFALMGAWNKSKERIADTGKTSLISRKRLLERIENTPIPEEYWFDERYKAYAKWLVESAEED